MIGQNFCSARKKREDFLRDVLRAVGIAVELTKGGRIHQADVPLDDLSERIFRPLFEVSAKQLGVIRHHRVQLYICPLLLKPN